jgi:hypothetical protein
VQLKVDVLVVVALSSIREVKQMTKTIPIVMVTLQDPVAAGVLDSLARPGGNITGLTRLTRDLSGKRLELFKEAVPGMRVPHTAQWTFTLGVSNHGADERVKTFTDYGGRFDTAGDAVSRGYDFAMKWIEKNRPNLLVRQIR